MSKLHLLFAISLVIALATLPAVSAQWSGIQYQFANGVVVLTNDEIGIRVSAINQVPHFQWWNLTAPGDDYHVQFVRIFEANDSNSDTVFSANEDHIIGQSFALHSPNWEFSGFYEEHQNDIITAVHFNFTNTETFTFQGPPSTPATESASDAFEIQIRVHFYLATPQQFKFDLYLSGWNWAEDISVLVFQFNVAQSAHEQNDDTEQPSEVIHSENRFTFGHAYMEYTQNAFATNGTHQVQVKGSYGQDTCDEEYSAIYLTFAHFEGNLDYDPTLGISGSSAVSIWDDLSIDYDQLLFLAGGLSIVALVIIGIRSKQ
ncbi:MAG: hypothetical protein EAX81_06610 [Candidatus Thorarchaeota archaeon]|nr:hypothetical protein [Candidatus Thorarchaeota archaeon]